MDLTRLITACALTVDPKIMHALIGTNRAANRGYSRCRASASRRSSEARPSVQRAALSRTMSLIGVGLAGLPGTPRSVTATMFAPCSNIASASRQIAKLAELCRTSSRSKGNPIYCAVAAWHGSWERPNNGFADMVLATAAKGDAPDFEMPPGTGNDTGEVSSSGHPTSRNTTPAMAPSLPPHDDERARQSSLFPVMAKPSDSSPSEHPGSDLTASGEQKNDAQTVPLTVTPPHVDSVFVPGSVQQSAPKSE